VEPDDFGELNGCETDDFGVVVGVGGGASYANCLSTVVVQKESERKKERKKDREKER